MCIPGKSEQAEGAASAKALRLRVSNGREVEVRTQRSREGQSFTQGYVGLSGFYSREEEPQRHET